jgi:hypothetical protein
MDHPITPVEVLRKILEWWKETEKDLNPGHELFGDECAAETIAFVISNQPDLNNEAALLEEIRDLQKQVKSLEEEKEHLRKRLDNV